MVGNKKFVLKLTDKEVDVIRNFLSYFFTQNGEIFCPFEEGVTLEDILREYFVTEFYFDSKIEIVLGEEDE